MRLLVFFNLLFAKITFCQIVLIGHPFSTIYNSYKEDVFYDIKYYGGERLQYGIQKNKDLVQKQHIKSITVDRFRNEHKDSYFHFYYSFDKNGLLLSLSDSGSNYLEFKYQENKLVKWFDKSNHSANYYYSDSGQLKNIYYITKSDTIARVNYLYNSLGEIIQIKDIGNETSTYDYVYTDTSLEIKLSGQPNKLCYFDSQSQIIKHFFNWDSSSKKFNAETTTTYIGDFIVNDRKQSFSSSKNSNIYHYENGLKKYSSFFNAEGYNQFFFEYDKNGLINELNVVEGFSGNVDTYRYTYTFWK